MLYQQILPLVRSTQAAQEFILAIWSEIENFQLQAVRQQLTKFRLANIDDIRRNPNAEDLAKVIENVPASYTGVIHICDNRKIEYIFRQHSANISAMTMLYKTFQQYWVIGSDLIEQI